MKVITIELTDLQWKLLQDISRDPEAWATNLVLARAAKSARIIQKAEQERLYADESVTALPGTIDELLENYFAQPGYKTLAQIREEEILAGAAPSGGLGEPTPPQEDPGE